ATPLLFFLGVPHDGRAKGNVMFQGFGILERAEMITQLHRGPTGISSFPNYRFDCVVMAMSAEGERFDWNWINSRRDGTKSRDECLAQAPSAWKLWVREGTSALGRVRRRAAELRIVKARDQRPAGGAAERALTDVYEFYANRKHRFEALAEI